MRKTIRTILLWIVGFLIIALSGANRANAAAGTGYQLVNAFGSLTFSQPLCIRTPPGETNRIFILEKTGLIQMVTNIGSANPAKTIYMDLRARLSTSSEQGLLGLAFHPQFQSNGLFYIYRSYAPGTGIVYERLSRFLANPPSAPTASTNTEVVLFDQQDDASNHNGGDLHFGNDGYLYVSLGDGGGQNDQLNNSQTIRKGFHSGLLRLDVDNLPENLPPNPVSSITVLTVSTNYSVPNDNPFVSTPFLWERNTSVTTNFLRTEYWAVGMRNPWRFSIDPVTGWIWVGDVGGGVREEVDVVSPGGNYGWVYREGFVGGPVSAPVGFTSIAPIFDYGHGTTATNTGNSITGGLVYRGDRFDELTNAYLFCDYVSGFIWALRYNGTSVTDFHNLLTNGVALKDTGIAAFGTDPRNGDILMANVDKGVVRRLMPLSPTLTVTRDSGQITLSWPAALDAFRLFATDDPGVASSWALVSDSRTLSGGRWNVSIPTTDANRFYRLQSP
jgi:glucose/arabinose dehydrogenase